MNTALTGYACKGDANFNTIFVAIVYKEYLARDAVNIA